jgi:hypothetical protein
MKWLLFQNVDNYYLSPIFGPLSEFAHGAVIYAIVLLFPGFLVAYAARKVRKGYAQYRSLTWWALVTWPLCAAWTFPHRYPRWSFEYRGAYALLAALTLTWITYFYVRVIPMLLRRPVVDSGA